MTLDFSIFSQQYLLYLVTNYRNISHAILSISEKWYLINCVLNFGIENPSDIKSKFLFTADKLKVQ